VCAAKAQGGRIVDVEVADDVATLGHDDRLEHVIGHLVQNALDASRSSDTVRVRVAREQAHAVVEVVDVGEGMTEEYVRDRLGKPFETTKPAGMGIGVYESSQYVTSVGGRLVIDSVRGEGTRVRVVLPLKDNAAAQAAAAGSEGAPPAPAAASPTETAASVGANS